MPLREKKPPSGQVVCIRLKPKDLSEVDQRAQSEGLDRSGWMRKVIFEALGKPPPVPKPHIPGSKFVEKIPLPPDEHDPRKPCPHPENKRKKTPLVEVCLQCGARL